MTMKADNHKPLNPVLFFQEQHEDNLLNEQKEKENRVALKNLKKKQNISKILWRASGCGAVLGMSLSLVCSHVFSDPSLGSFATQAFAILGIVCMGWFGPIGATMSSYFWAQEHFLDFKQPSEDLIQNTKTLLKTAKALSNEESVIEGIHNILKKDLSKYKNIFLLNLNDCLEKFNQAQIEERNIEQEEPIVVMKDKVSLFSPMILKI